MFSRTNLSNTDIIDSNCIRNDFGYRFEVMLADCTELACESQDFEVAACDFLKNVIETVAKRGRAKTVLAGAIEECNAIIDYARWDMGLTSLVA